MGYFNVIELGNWERISKGGWEGVVREVGGKLGECDGLKIKWVKVLIRGVIKCVKWCWEVSWDEDWGLIIGLIRVLCGSGGGEIWFISSYDLEAGLDMMLILLGGKVNN